MKFGGFGFLFLEAELGGFLLRFLGVFEGAIVGTVDGSVGAVGVLSFVLFRFNGSLGRPDLVRGIAASRCCVCCWVVRLVSILYSSLKLLGGRSGVFNRKYLSMPMSLAGFPMRQSRLASGIACRGYVPCSVRLEIVPNRFW